MKWDKREFKYYPVEVNLNERGEIDIRTKQVLIEAFIVEANSDFERALGTRLGGYYKRQGKQIGGVAGTSSAGTFSATDSAALGSTDRKSVV